MKGELGDGTVTIKKIIPEYVHLLFEAISKSKDELSVWLPWCHPGYNIEETKDWVKFQQKAWDEKLEYSFAVFDADNDLVGGCGLNQMNPIHKIGNLGYWIGSGYRGKGYAAAATRLCAEFGFNELRLNRIEIIAAKENIGSQRVAEKAGAKKECLARKRLVVGEKVHDAYVYSLVKEDLQNL